MSAVPARVLVVTDGSPWVRRVAAIAAEQASRAGAELHLVHVGEVPAMYHREMRGYRSEAGEDEARAGLRPAGRTGG